MSERFASTPPVAANRAPDAFGGGGHWQIGDADGGGGVEDRVHDGRRRGDGAAFAETFGAEWIRSLYWIVDGLHPLLVQLRQMPKPAVAAVQVAAAGVGLVSRKAPAEFPGNE